jgi:hypothetical protein
VFALARSLEGRRPHIPQPISGEDAKTSKHVQKQPCRSIGFPWALREYNTNSMQVQVNRTKSDSMQSNGCDLPIGSASTRIKFEQRALG